MASLGSGGTHGCGHRHLISQMPTHMIDNKAGMLVRLPGCMHRRTYCIQHTSLHAHKCVCMQLACCSAHTYRVTVEFFDIRPTVWKQGVYQRNQARRHARGLESVMHLRIPLSCTKVFGALVQGGLGQRSAGGRLARPLPTCVCIYPAACRAHPLACVWMGARATQSTAQGMNYACGLACVPVAAGCVRLDLLRTCAI